MSLKKSIVFYFLSLLLMTCVVDAITKEQVDLLAGQPDLAAWKTAIETVGTLSMLDQHEENVNSFIAAAGGRDLIKSAIADLKVRLTAVESIKNDPANDVLFVGDFTSLKTDFDATQKMVIDVEAFLTAVDVLPALIAARRAELLAAEAELNSSESALDFSHTAFLLAKESVDTLLTDNEAALVAAETAEQVSLVQAVLDANTISTELTALKDESVALLAVEAAYVVSRDAYNSVYASPATDPDYLGSIVGYAATVEALQARLAPLSADVAAKADMLRDNAVLSAAKSVLVEALDGAEAAIVRVHTTLVRVAEIIGESDLVGALQ